MTIEEFEKKIQKEIDKRLSIKPTQPDISGVYLDGAPLYISLPRHEIMPERSEFFMDTNGHPYRGVKEAMKDIKTKVENMNQEKFNLLRG